MIYTASRRFPGTVYVPLHTVESAANVTRQMIVPLPHAPTALPNRSQLPRANNGNIITTHTYSIQCPALPALVSRVMVPEADS